MAPGQMLAAPRLAAILQLNSCFRAARSFLQPKVKFEPFTEQAQDADKAHPPLGTICIQLPKESRVTTKTRGVISPLGEIIAHDVSTLSLQCYISCNGGGGIRRFVGSHWAC